MRVDYRPKHHPHPPLRVGLSFMPSGYASGRGRRASRLEYRIPNPESRIPIIPLGDNCQITIPTMTRQFIDRTQIIFPGSGALAELVYDFSPLPVQQTTWGTIKSLYEAQ